MKPMMAASPAAPKLASRGAPFWVWVGDDADVLPVVWDADAATLVFFAGVAVTDALAAALPSTKYRPATKLKNVHLQSCRCHSTGSCRCRRKSRSGSTDRARLRDGAVCATTEEIKK